MATLVFEIALTRVFSLAHWYHFAFLSVSTALLGFGASGSLLAFFSPRVTREGSQYEHALSLLAFLFSLGIVGSFISINYLPFDSYHIAWEPIQFFYLALYYLVLAVPFFLSGLIIGLLLTRHPGQAHLTYAANLLGSAAGCLAALGFLPWFGGGGTIVMAAIGGLLGAAFFGLSPSRTRLGRTRYWLAVGVLAATTLALVACLLVSPAFLEVRLSPYKALSQALRVPGARVVFSAWNAFSRVDVIESRAIRSAPGLSLTYPYLLPVQMGLTVDGGNLQPVTRWISPEDARFVSYLPMSLPYLLVANSKALIIEPRGGLEVLVALQNGAQTVVAVESNPLVARAIREVYGDFTGHLYNDPRVRLVTEDGRAYLHRSRELFDIIQIALADTYQPVTSGAYSLAENYLYTQEAFVEALQHLAPHGILAATRWLQFPPSEEVRLGSLAVAALGRLGITEPGQHVMALRSWSTLTLLAKRQAFSPAEVATLRAFCAARQFDLVYYPGMPPDEANQYHIFAEPVYYRAFAQLLSGRDTRAFYAESEYDVSPPSDNRPFFFHFFKWRQVPRILQTLGKTWQPFGGSGYLVLLFLLGVAALVSGLFILLPLLGRRLAVSSPARPHVLGYFAALGLGYLFVELPLIQRFILFLGQPVYAFSAVLCALLLFSGWGSFLAPRLPWRASLLGLSALICLYPLLLPALFDAFLRFDLAIRLPVAILSLAPLGFLMGIPFAKGIAIVDRIAPSLIPWAWGINGCASVLSSILATLLALSWGFSLVLIAASGAYLVALLAFWTLPEMGSRG